MMDDYYKQMMDSGVTSDDVFGDGDALREIVENGSAHDLARYSFGVMRDTMQRVMPEALERAETLYKVEGGNWTADQIDEFVDDFIQYVDTGKAKPAVRRVFDSSQEFMSKIYHGARGTVGESNVSPEVAAVFEAISKRPDASEAVRGSNLATLIGNSAVNLNTDVFKSRLVERLGDPAKDIADQIYQDRLDKATRQALAAGQQAGDDISDPGAYLEKIMPDIRHRCSQQRPTTFSHASRFPRT